MNQPRILMVIAPDQFRDEEFFDPYQTFTQTQGWSVTVCSTQVGEAQGMLGGTYAVEKTVGSQSADDYEALVIPGGMGSITYLWENPDLLQLVKTFAAQNKVIGAICLSGAVLAKAGILQGKKATVWPADEAKQALAEGGASYVEEDVVVDGRVVTSPGPHASQAFADQLVQLLKSVPVAH